MEKEIKEITLKALEEIANMHGIDLHEDPGINTRIIGKNGILDSLAFVTYVVAIEGKINQRFNAQISLQDERAFSQTKSPFRSIGDLIEYITALLKEQNKT